MIRRSTWPWLLLSALVAIGCKSRSAAPAGETGREGPEAISVTHFTDRTELFVEFPPLVRGQDSAFAVHLTRLTDFKPVAEGRVTIVLSGAGAPEERWTADHAQVPGIFRPVARPASAGERSLTIIVEAGGGPDPHELGAVTVHATAADAARAAAAEAPPATPRITYLKEQQWRTEFATELVSERTLRASVAANGVLRARPEGEARITAPAAGRLVTAGATFPRIGMQVRKNDVLTVLAPRLGADADLATLELARDRARIELEHAQHERERLERLLEEHAVPERRVAEARAAEATARAELDAAGRRLAHYHGESSAAGAGSAGRMPVRSPIAGVVVAAHVSPGTFVEEGYEMFHVVDLARLWLEVQIPEVDIARVRAANAAWFEVEGFDHAFEVSAATGGRVVALGGALDPASRTAPLVFELDNPERVLRVGMFARARVLTGESVSSAAIPRSAVVEEGGQDVAYVEVEGEAFERRVLRLGLRDGDFVQVLEGLRPGERVVTKGAYYIRLAASSGAVPAHGHVH